MDAMYIQPSVEAATSTQAAVIGQTWDSAKSTGQGLGSTQPAQILPTTLDVLLDDPQVLKALQSDPNTAGLVTQLSALQSVEVPVIIADTQFDETTGAPFVPDEQRAFPGRRRIRDPLTGIAEPGGASLLNGDVVIDFGTSIYGTLTDQDGEGTGFTSVMTNLTQSQQTLLNSQRVNIDPASGLLTVAAEDGSDATANTLKNALQIPIGSVQYFTISSRLKPSTDAPASNGVLGGVFLGADQDNYIQLTVVKDSNGIGLQFFQEENGSGAPVGGTTNPIYYLPDQSIETLDLFLVGNPLTNTICAAYRVNSSTALPVLLDLNFSPTNSSTFFADKTQAHAGILPSSLANEGAIAYDSFSVQYDGETVSLPVASPQQPDSGERPDEPFSVKVNFQPDDAATPAGFIKDSGKAYSRDRGYGWVEASSLDDAKLVPLDISANARDRNRAGIVQELDTFLHLQYPSQVKNQTAVKTSAAWQYDLPNGRYKVTVAVGDQANYDSKHTINIEGMNAIKQFQGSSSNEYRKSTVEVEVTDGQLTIDAMGGINTKLSYVEIEAIA